MISRLGSCSIADTAGRREEGQRFQLVFYSTKLQFILKELYNLYTNDSSIPYLVFILSRATITCSQWDAALLLLASDWTDAIGNVLDPSGKRRQGRQPANTTHLNWAQRQVTHKAGAILDETAWNRRGKRVQHFTKCNRTSDPKNRMSYLDMSLCAASRAVV